MSPSRRVMLRRQQGMALVSALLLLLVVTILAVSMFRSYGVQEKIAGNTREKQRAVNAAVSAQQYAEWFLSSGTAPSAVTCGAGFVSSAVGQVCNNPTLPTFTTLPWTTGVNFIPFTQDSGNGVMNVVNAASPTFGTYYQAPAFYIADLGHQAGGTGEVYQIDAIGFGGSPNAVAVVESTYLISTPTAKSPDK